MTLTEVTVGRDIATTYGIIAAGQKRYAAPSGDGRWLLFLWLPSGPRKARAVLTPPQWVKHGAKRLRSLEREAAIRADYEHARFNMGMDNDDALRWLAQGYGGLSWITLRRLGFNTYNLERQEREARLMKRRAAS
ncbi:hypothetical protein [Nocardia otitidiscaviarum]|uniref:hypothetical protein n=1 Tax=Nocardia otitidiscaviarum TaxID=1823 RepID=UPI0004A6D4FA|nr:hypothetical protein [Nocardia otitidiscaviarum]